MTEGPNTLVPYESPRLQELRQAWNAALVVACGGHHAEIPWSHYLRLKAALNAITGGIRSGGAPENLEVLVQAQTMSDLWADLCAAVPALRAFASRDVAKAALFGLTQDLLRASHASDLPLGHIRVSAVMSLIEQRTSAL